MKLTPGRGPKTARKGRARPGVRVVSYLVTVALLVVLNFLLPRTMPGDPIEVMLGSSARSTGIVGDAATRSSLTHYYGLDRPLGVQFGRYLKGLARGDLGVSITRGTPVTGLLARRLPWTLLLAVTAVVLAALVGVAPGVMSAWRRGRGGAGSLGTFIAMQNLYPPFLASLVLFVFAVKLGWFPLTGATSVFPDSLAPVSRVADVVHHLVLPASVMAVQLAAANFLTMRAGMVGELGSGYLQLGRAKGLGERRLKYRYAARNALLPVTSNLSLQLAFAVGIGPIFIERVFGYPGIGSLAADAVGARDYPTLQGCFLVLTLIIVSANFATDLVYRRLDPRTSA